MLGYLSAAILVVVLGVVASENRSSPCPDQFKYLEEKPGQWTGELNFQSEYVLHGLWARIIFDAPITGIKTEEYGNFDSDSNKPNEILVKSYDAVIRKNKPTVIPFTVLHQGEQVPKLVGYRINGRTFCPEGQDK